MRRAANLVPWGAWALVLIVGAGAGAAAQAQQTASPTAEARPAGTDEHVSFNQDVLAVLTRYDCNSGGCHGKLAGQNGFRLSLRGYAPELDHEWIVREYTGRRVSRAAPEESLLLRKARGELAHGGGKVLDRDSAGYRVLLDWVRQGLPGPIDDDPAIEQLLLSAADPSSAEPLPAGASAADKSPAEATLPDHTSAEASAAEPLAAAPSSAEPLLLRPGDVRQLRVAARYADGRLRDVTWLAKFRSADPATVDVDPHGRLHVLRHGETAVTAAFLGQIATAVVTVPFDRQFPPERYAERNNFIDDHVLAKLAALRIAPSPLSTDEEFLRRVFLDLIGTLPSPDEARAFLADTSPTKRETLIDALLKRPEFVDYWALQFSDLLQNRRLRDQDVRGTKDVRALHAWLREQVAANRPWDALVREVLTASGPANEQPAVGYFVVTIGVARSAPESEVVASVAQAFLGTRIGCAQCHNHPLERYTQDDYYHFAAFFSQTQLVRRDARDGSSMLKAVTPEPGQERKPIAVLQPRTGQMLAPRPLDRSIIAVDADADADVDVRGQLVDWMTRPDNELFAGALVNRVWRHMLGVGLVEPVDDLRATNPPSNGELWQALVRDFADSGYDVRHLLRTIARSRSYQRSSRTEDGNESDTRFYSHYYARRLPAEVLLDAVSQAADVPHSFPGYPLGIRAIQLPDPGVNSYFLSLFGRSERVTACACERSGDVTLPQLLHLQNGDTVLDKIQSGEGRVARLLKSQDELRPIVEELFLSTLSRPASDDELAAVESALAGGAPRDEVLRDLVWALVNSKEFSFNH